MFVLTDIGPASDGVDFTFSSEVVQYDEDDSTKKRVERRLIPNYRWPLNPDEPFIVIEEYVTKLKKMFEN